MAWSTPRIAAIAAAVAVVAVGAVLAVALGDGDEEATKPEKPSRAERLAALGVKRPPPRVHDKRPNIVVVMTDDQEGSDMRVMPRTRRLIGRRGVSFPESVTNYPLCCPSRATYQTGQYAHNHGVLDNRPPKGGFGRLDTSNTVPMWMARAGYSTAYIGKYLNGYGEDDPEFIPPGWTTWMAMVAPVTRYFKFRLNENGAVHQFGESPHDYVADVLTRKAVRYLKRQRNAKRPFWLTVGYLAPHVGKGFNEAEHCDGKGPFPAPRDFGHFAGTELPRGPAFNEDDVSDKPRAVRQLPKVTGHKLEKKTDKYQCRLESLRSVDEGVAKIVRELRETGELDNTYVVFTSDNGFIQGEHRIKGGKGQLYEESIKVPLLVRGPGVPAGRRSRDLVVNADLPATFLDLAGARPRLPQDGGSLLPALRDPSLDRHRPILIESLDYEAVRTERYLYAEYRTGERELYDLKRDPYELRSRDDDPNYAGVADKLARTLHRLEDCAGESCHL